MGTAVQTMTGSVSSTPHHESPITTAPVREHVCLFTHDLRRKQKRWQDGRLKYHTFNRRVMVYDDRGGFIGDTHWRADYELADGDDFELERGGIIVQIGECVGSTDQDLSELIDKRAEEKARRQAAAAKRPPTTPIAPHRAVKPQSLPSKHLHDVIGMPSGHFGRAVVPTESPYDQRQREGIPSQTEATRPAKRQRIDASPQPKSGYAQNLFGATLTLSGCSSSQALPRHRLPKVHYKHNPETLISPAATSRSSHDMRQGVAEQPSRGRAVSPPAEDTVEDIELRGKRPRMSMNTSAQRDAPTRPELHQPTPNLGKLDTSKPVQGGNHLKAQKENKGHISKPSPLSTRSPNQDLHKAGEIKMGSECCPTLPPSDSRVQPGVPSKTRTISHDKQPQGHRPNPTDMIDLTIGQPKSPRELKEIVTTELRIKPRKKRGLLMVSEKSAHASSRSSDAICVQDLGDTGASQAGESTAKGDLPGLSRQTKSRRVNKSADNDNGFKRGRQLSYSRSHSPAATDGLDDAWLDLHSQGRAEKTEKDRPPAEEGLYKMDDIGSTRRRPSSNRFLDIDSSLSDRPHETRARPASTRTEEDSAKEDMPPPRLAKLGRRSIRSREVIGLVFDEGLDAAENTKSALESQSAQKPVTKKNMANKSTEGAASREPRNTEPSAARESTVLLRQDGARRESLLGKEMVTDDKVEIELPSTTDSPVEPSAPLINNPATRGKKAARPADAAGRMPVCPLPKEADGSQSAQQVDRRRKTGGDSDKDNPRPLPGFSKANGGPWSREAHDLFDFKRPP